MSTALAAQLSQQNLELSGQRAFDEAAIRWIAQQHDATRADALVEREKLRFEVLAVLSPQQQIQVMQMTENARGQLQVRLDHLSELI